MIVFLILVICPLDKSLVFSWVLTQHFLWQFLFYIIIKINGIRYQKRDLQKARLFSDTFGFIADLCTINDHVGFDGNFKNVYLSELQLKKENILTFGSIIFMPFYYNWNKQFKTQLYDKRYAFPHSVVRTPHLDIKTPTSIY